MRQWLAPLAVGTPLLFQLRGDCGEGDPRPQVRGGPRQEIADLVERRRAFAREHRVFHDRVHAKVELDRQFAQFATIQSPLPPA